MLSSLFSKIFAEEQPAEDKEPAKAEEVTEEKTEEAPAEAEEAEEPEDVSCRIRLASPKKWLKNMLLLLIRYPSFLRTFCLLWCH